MNPVMAGCPRGAQTPRVRQKVDSELNCRAEVGYGSTNPAAAGFPSIHRTSRNFPIMNFCCQSACKMTRHRSGLDQRPTWLRQSQITERRTRSVNDPRMAVANRVADGTADAMA